MKEYFLIEAGDVIYEQKQYDDLPFHDDGSCYMGVMVYRDYINDYTKRPIKILEWGWKCGNGHLHIVEKYLKKGEKNIDGYTRSSHRCIVPSYSNYKKILCVECGSKMKILKNSNDLVCPVEEKKEALRLFDKKPTINQVQKEMIKIMGLSCKKDEHTASEIDQIEEDAYDGYSYTTYKDLAKQADIRLKKALSYYK